QKIGVPTERIVPLPSSENFWSVGGPGPCGPDSEIYYDWGEAAGCGEADCAPGCTRCERFLEFWNLVFMEYELHPDGELTPLPKQNIDTGMGLERTARILQDAPSVYDTDGYQSIMAWIASRSGVAYGFPIELTTELARERGLPVDEDGYAKLMAEHRDISRAGGEKGEAQRAAEFAREAGFKSEFVGYEKVEVLTQLGAVEELGDGRF